MNTPIVCRQLLAVLSFLMVMMLAPRAIADESTSTIAIEQPVQTEFAPGYIIEITGFYTAVKGEELVLAAVGQSDGIIALINVYNAGGAPVAASVRSAPYKGMQFVSVGSRLRLLEPIPPPGTIRIFGYEEALSMDSDGDGIPDDRDACPDSIMSDTVIIGDCNSGVVNNLFPDGCTLADLVQACADGARNHGQFVRAVVDLSRNLQKSGVLTQRDAVKLGRCAARSK
jgi:hypothetical protein